MDRHQPARRKLRRQLGFCVYCTEPAAPGFTVCDYHRAQRTRGNARDRAKKAKARGWRMKRVRV